VTIVAVDECVESGSVANCESCGRFCIVEIMVGICFAVKSLVSRSDAQICCEVGLYAIFHQFSKKRQSAAIVACVCYSFSETKIWDTD
jgi:hypothetical protein